MATQLADILFAIIAVAIVVSQAFILRSTARGMRYSDAKPTSATGAHSRSAALEWTYAIVPAIALALLLVFSWRAMHPDAVRVQGVAPSMGTGR